MSRRTLALFAVLAVAFAVLTGVAVRMGVLSTQGQTAAVGGPFQLVDQSGRKVDQRLLKGKWSAVFFGFTQCPDACPTTMFALGQAEKQLGKDSKDFQTVFITIDPARDTPKVLAEYLTNAAYPRNAWALTGSDAEVAQAAKAYHVFYQKAGTGPNYTMNHSTITYLMTPRGRFACVIPYGAAPDEMVQRVKAAMKQGAGAQSC